MQGCDTPATRRQRASHGAKPPPLPVSSALQGREGQDGAPVGGGNPATAYTEGATTKQISPSTSRAAPLPVQNSPSTPLAPHVRDKTLPARPPSPHFRYKTLPAHPKWPNLAQSTHAGRVLYRFHHQEAEQGEFCTEHKAEIELANTTAHQAPPVWRTPEGPEEPESQAAVQAAGWQGQHGLAGPPPHKFRMQFDWSKFQQTKKTLQFQRCKFNV